MWIVSIFFFITLNKQTIIPNVFRTRKVNISYFKWYMYPIYTTYKYSFHYIMIYLLRDKFWLSKNKYANQFLDKLILLLYDTLILSNSWWIFFFHESILINYHIFFYTQHEIFKSNILSTIRNKIHIKYFSLFFLYLSIRYE